PEFDDREDFDVEADAEAIAEPDDEPADDQGPAPPPRPRGRSRGRDRIRERRSRDPGRERPDLSEKGRRERSVPRPFRAGLTDALEDQPGPGLPPKPEPADAPRPERPRLERPAPPAIPPTSRRSAEGPREFGRGLDFEVRPPDEPEPMP